MGLKLIGIFLLFTTEIVTAGTFFGEKDKQAHMAAGYAIGLTTNLAITHLGMTRVDGAKLSSWEKALWCSLISFGAGAAFEYVHRRSSPPDPMDVLATGIGGVASGLFTIAIDF